MRTRLTIVLLLLMAAAVSSHVMAQAPPVAPLPFGEPFPAMTLKNINEGPGGPAEIDLGRVLGKRPIILYYWIAGHPTSEAMFLELQALAADLGPEKVTLYGVAAERPGLPMSVIEGRIRDLKIHVPILDDKDFRILQSLKVTWVPSINVLDTDGKLCLTNAGSLRQGVEYKMDVEKAIRRATDGKTLGTYGSMPRYYPAEELVGEPCPDFQATLVDGEVRSWHSLIEPDKVNVLVFWAVDCGHCRAQLPGINEWLKTNAEGINFIAAASVPNEAIKIQTTEFCKNQEFVFPVFMDESGEIAGKYKIVSTPTYLVIRGDGVVDSVILRAADIGGQLEAKKKELLETASGG